jgi:hypothetical protein
MHGEVAAHVKCLLQGSSWVPNNGRMHGGVAECMVRRHTFKIEHRTPSDCMPLFVADPHAFSRKREAFISV